MYYLWCKANDMKNLFAIALIALVFACNNRQKASPDSEANNAIVNEGGDANDSLAGGKKLIGGNDCSGCHNTSTNLTGPPFMDISKRYPNASGVAENLAHSIISGSKGVFQNVHEMPPHPAIKFSDAVKMATYILSLKDQAKRDSLNSVR